MMTLHITISNIMITVRAQFSSWTLLAICFIKFNYSNPYLYTLSWPGHVKYSNSIAALHCGLKAVYYSKPYTELLCRDCANNFFQFVNTAAGVYSVVQHYYALLRYGLKLSQANFIHTYIAAVWAKHHTLMGHDIHLPTR